jgi:hypothetical protein
MLSLTSASSSRPPRFHGNMTKPQLDEVEEEEEVGFGTEVAYPHESSPRDSNLKSWMQIRQQKDWNELAPIETEINYNS